MTDVARVSTVAVKQITINKNASANSGRHRHRAEISYPLCGTKPPLSQRKRFRIKITVDRQSSEICEKLAQRKFIP